jgi:hypothetical protein
MGLKDYTDDDRRLTEDGSCPDAMVNVQNLIKRHIKIAPYDTNPVTTHVAPKIGVTYGILPNFGTRMTGKKGDINPELTLKT